MKRFLMLTMLAVLFALTGCSEGEQKFAAALLKFNGAEYAESSSNVAFAIDYTGTDENFQNQMRAFERLAAAYTLQMDSEFEQDLEDGTSKVHMDFSWALDPVAVNLEMWADLDLENGKYDIALKVPELARAFLPEEYNKDYAVIDYVELLTVDNDSPAAVEAVKKIFAFAQEAQSDPTGVMEKLGFSGALEGNVTVASKTNGGNETLTLTMNDEQFKDFIIAYVKSAKTNEALKEYAYSFGMSRVGLFELNPIELAPEVLEELDVDMSAAMDELVVRLEEVFEKSTVLGEDGLVYELTADKNGNLTGSVLSLDVLLNAELFPYTDYEAYTEDVGFEEIAPDGQISFTMDIVSEYSDVNNGKRVAMPNLTDENSVDVMEAVRLQKEKTAEAEKFYFPSTYVFETDFTFLEDAPANFPLTGSAGGTEFDTEITLLYNDYSLYMPLEQAAEVFGGTVEYNEEDQSAVWETGSGPLTVYTEASEEVYSENFMMENESAFGIMFEEELYVNLDSLEFFCDIDLGFDQETETVLAREYPVY